MPVRVPSADEALDAIADGNADELAAYLQATPMPDHRVILALARALSAEGDTLHRLKFERRRAGRPPADPIREMAIFVQVEALKLGGLNQKKAVGKVAADYSLSEQTISDICERVKARAAS